MEKQLIPGVCWWERWAADDPNDELSRCGHPKMNGVCPYADFKTPAMTHKLCPFCKDPGPSHDDDIGSGGDIDSIYA